MVDYSQIFVALLAWILLALIFFLAGFKSARFLGWTRKSYLRCLLILVSFSFLVGIEIAFGYLPAIKDAHIVLRVLAHILPLFAMWFGSKFCVIGLTGGIACGKSTLSNVFMGEPDFVIIDADKIAHEIMRNDESLKREVV